MTKQGWAALLGTQVSVMLLFVSILIVLNRTNTLPHLYNSTVAIKGDKGDAAQVDYAHIDGEIQSRLNKALADLPKPKDGKDGADAVAVNGLNGTNGTNGTNGSNGASAYDLWLGEGNKGTVNDFLASLQGPIGLTGDPASPFQVIEYWEKDGKTVWRCEGDTIWTTLASNPVTRDSCL